MKPLAKSTDQQTEVVFVFVQSNASKKTDCSTIDIVCYNCGKSGHYARNYPSKKSYMNATAGDDDNGQDNKSMNDEHIFHQTGGGDLSKDCVLLDNQIPLIN